MPIIVEQLGKRNLWIKSRDENGKAKTEVDETFEPYFYDDKKQKVIAEASGDVPEMRKRYVHHYEADIPYAQRYIIDRLKIPLPDEPLRISYFDMENNYSLDTENTPEPITIMSFFDNFLDRYVSFLWRKDLKNEKYKKRVIIPEYNFDQMISVHAFNTEEAMLLKVINFIEGTDPDLLAGYNSGGFKSGRHPFDWLYIIRRMRLLKLPERKLSPLRYIKLDTKYNKVVIKGRIPFDVMQGYKKMTLSVRNSLEYVAKKELGLNKLKVDLKEVWNNIDELIKYNIADTFLLKEIDIKKKITEGFNDARRIHGCTWSALTSEIMKTDALILREARKRGIPLPTREHDREREGGLKGGWVMKVTPGLHKNVVVLDLKSLYTSLICQYNISFDTMRNSLNEGDIKFGGTFIVNQREEGMVPAVLKNLFIQRELYKTEMKKCERHSPEWETYNMLQEQTKLSGNAMYGQMGTPMSRYYELRAANAITWLGRQILKWTIKITESIPNYNVIYADTDSIFVKKDTEWSIDEINHLLKVINSSYTNFIKQHGIKENNYLRLDFKGIFKSVLFTEAKKRYIGWLVNDGNKYITPEIEVKGFEIRRKDFSDFGRDLMMDIFKMILDEKTKDEVDRFVMRKREEIKTVKDLRRIAISKRINKEFDKYERKDTVVSGAEFANEHLREDFKGGSEMYHLYCHSVEVDGKTFPTNSVCFMNSEPKVDVNWERMIQLTIDGKVEKIYAAIGWSTDIGNMTLDRWQL